MYEVKLDGFRCMAFVDGERGVPAVAQRQAARPLLPRAGVPAGRYVLDGEIVVRDADGARGLRRARPAHPPGRLAHRAPGGRDARRVRRLRSARARADGRCWSGRSPSAAPRCEQLLGGRAFAGAPVELMVSVATERRRRALARDAEGAIAKERSAPYLPGERKGMVKVKRVRTIDAVVAGWRPGKEPDTVGALILGSLRRRRSCASSVTAPGSPRPRSAGWSTSSRRMRRASAARPTPAAGARAGSWSGWRCAPSWSWRSTSTTCPRGASATAPSCGAGARTSRPPSARSISSSAERRRGSASGAASTSDRAHATRRRPSPRRSTCRSCSGCRRRACR